MVGLDHLEVRIAVLREAVQGLEVVDREENRVSRLRVSTSSTISLRGTVRTWSAARVPSSAH